MDPIALEIIEGSLQAACEEMLGVIQRTAMSPIIYEVLDLGTGITDPQGNLVASGAGIPTFVAVLDKVVKKVLDRHSVIQPGDIFVTNDPAFGGVTHLNDVALVAPVFVDDCLVAWVGNMAHWSDVGGLAPGSLSTRAEQIYQEGLRLPAIRLAERGQLLRPVLEILKANSRMPEHLQGDLWAQIAALRLGIERIRALACRFGSRAFLNALAVMLDEGERRAVDGLARLPVGTFLFEEEQDDGVLFRVKVAVDHASFIVDLRDNPDQRPGPYNLYREATEIAAQMIFKAVVDPGRRANAGVFRPLRVITRPGSIFDAQPPAACGFYYELRMRVYDLIWRCLATQIEGLLPAGHFATIGGTVISGIHPDTGKRFTLVEPQVGGWGASPHRDGESALFSAFHGETYVCPAEVAEARYGLYVESFRLNEEPGGEGHYRGGRGVVREYVLRGEAVLAVGFTRYKKPPWGLAGGHPGFLNRVEVARADGAIEVYGFISDLALKAGDRVRVLTGSGGGYGVLCLDPAP